MDRLPKLRRKPKPPTIETSLERISSGVVDTPNGAAHDSTTSVGTLDHHHHHHHQQQQQPPPLLRNRILPPLKSSPFRSFRSRPSFKRPRCMSSPDQPSITPIIADAVCQGGLRSQARLQSALDGTDEKRQGPSQPGLPAFLTLTPQEIDRKFQDIIWAERLRLADAQSRQNVKDYKWGHFHQLNLPHLCLMDRYRDIRPWNHNRVKLQVPENQLDYVNASTIALRSAANETLPPLRYIAMQGPTAASLDYVWRMIAEGMPSPAVIVQLTTMTENGSLKCHQYFPHSDDDATWILNKDDVWGDGWTARLTFASFEESADGAIEIRKLLLDIPDQKQTRVVWHLLYSRWPDFGVPTWGELDSFFNLMKLSRHRSAPDAPRIVHCSAGVGRTGTFITLEHLMRELDHGAPGQWSDAAEDADPVHDTVESLRQQRRGMVHAKIQFHFLYRVMRKLWYDRYGGGEGLDLDEPHDFSDEPLPKRLELADPFITDSDGESDGPARGVCDVDLGRYYRGSANAIHGLGVDTVR